MPDLLCRRAQCVAVAVEPAIYVFGGYNSLDIEKCNLTEPVAWERFATIPVEFKWAKVARGRAQ